MTAPSLTHRSKPVQTTRISGILIAISGIRSQIRGIIDRSDRKFWKYAEDQEKADISSFHGLL